jgi:uncharacterized lipoprotein
MKKTWLIPAACIAVAALLGACSMDKPDLRYRDSSLREPLAVPQGLDGPQHSQTMDIPPAGSGTGAGTGAAAPGAQDIELPPDLRAGGPGQDQGAAQARIPLPEKGPAPGPGPGSAPAPAPAQDPDKE